MNAAVTFCILVIWFSTVQSWKFKKYPYADLSLEQKVTHDGYPIQKYKITTEDQYILTVFRIKYGRNSTGTMNRSPVLLLHGMYASAEVFVLLGKYKSLAFFLADSGFDVWILNNRGCMGSEKHLKYNLNIDPSYWNFDFQEIAVYDIPSTIDLIVKETNQKPFIIGHSQGTTCYSIMSSERPEYNDKVKMAVAYAPAIVLNHQNIPANKFMIYISGILEAIWDLLSMKEMLPFLHQLHKLTFKHLCREQTFFLDLCLIILSMIGTHTSLHLDRDLVPVIIASPLPRVSSKQVFHYLQIAKSGYFRQYDYGKKQNLKIYNQTTPPNYNVQIAMTPTAVFFAENDEYCTAQSRQKIIKMFRNVVFNQTVGYFNHIDFIFARNAPYLVYERTVQLFNDFNKQNKLS